MTDGPAPTATLVVAIAFTALLVGEGVVSASSILARPLIVGVGVVTGAFEAALDRRGTLPKLLDPIHSRDWIQFLTVLAGSLGVLFALYRFPYVVGHLAVGYLLVRSVRSAVALATAGSAPRANVE